MTNPIDDVVNTILNSEKDHCVRARAVLEMRGEQALPKKQKLELLSPGGNLEKLKTALAFGADAVYVGIPDFSLRVRINDFDIEKIKEATKYCHTKKKKIYVTVNIFAHNKHLEKLPPYLEELKKIQVDALIISDPGVLAMVKEIWPEAEIHLSTQANCTNWRSAKFWADSGVKRIILGREVSLAEIKEIHQRVPEVDLEYFVHGAMCMAYSGRCFLSKYFVDRSANLGDCVQPCRWKYYISEEKRPNMPLELVEEQHGSYILNSKDLNLLSYLKELKEAGITSFKIEGRAKSVYYQALIAGIYSYALENIDNISQEEIDYFQEELKTKIISRGYTTGFLLGEKADQDIENTHQKINWEFCGVVVGENEKGENLIKVHNSIKVGDEIEVVMPKYEVVKMKIEKIKDAKTGKEEQEAHGGQEKTILLKLNKKAPKYSVLRRFHG